MVALATHSLLLEIAKASKADKDLIIDAQGPYAIAGEMTNTFTYMTWHKWLTSYTRSVELQPLPIHY